MKCALSPSGTFLREHNKPFLPSVLFRTHAPESFLKTVVGKLPQGNAADKLLRLCRAAVHHHGIRGKRQLTAAAPSLQVRTCFIAKRFTQHWSMCVSCTNAVTGANSETSSSAVSLHPPHGHSQPPRCKDVCNVQVSVELKASQR